MKRKSSELKDEEMTNHNHTLIISAITHHAFYPTQFRNIPLRYLLATMIPCSCRSRSCLPTSMSSPVPPSQTLGVLFFPLSPPSHKGATHNQRVTSSSARLQGWATTQMCWGFPTPTIKSVSLSFLSIAIHLSQKSPLFFSSLPSLYPLKP